MKKKQTEFLNYAKIRGIIGRSEIQKVNNRKSIIFSLMTQYTKVNNDETIIETTWINVLYWAKENEEIPELIKNKTVVEIEGRLQWMRYTRADGTSALNHRILANSMEILGTTDEIELQA